MPVTPLPPNERRSPRRVPTPACPTCTNGRVTAIARLPARIYFRCHECGRLMIGDQPNVDRPTIPLPLGLHAELD